MAAECINRFGGNAEVLMLNETGLKGIRILLLRTRIMRRLRGYWINSWRRMGWMGLLRIVSDRRLI